jgi:hypothetical protein
MKRWLAASALVVAFAAGSPVAFAGPPEHFTDSIDYSGSSSCGSFNDLYEGHLDVSGITTFDQNGNPVQDVVHITGWERNWRSDKPSVSFTAKRTFTVLFDYATSTEKDVGMASRPRFRGTAFCSTTSATSSSTTRRSS